MLPTLPFFTYSLSTLVVYLNAFSFCVFLSSAAAVASAVAAGIYQAT